MKNLLSPKKQKGFTLIELMVAMFIAILIMSLLIGITNNAMAAWQRGRAETRATRQAKAMLDVMTKDLEAMIVRKGNDYQWLYSEVDQDIPGGQTLQSPNAASFSFFTSATDRYDGEAGTGTGKDKGGDVCNVTYKLTYQDPQTGEDGRTKDTYATFVFYRRLVNPDETFANYLALSGTDALKNKINGDGKPRYETAGASSNSSGAAEYKFVCENILQFSLTYRVDVSVTNGSNTTTKPVRITLGSDSNANYFNLYGGSAGTSSGSTVNSPITTDAEPADGVTIAQLQAGKLMSVEVHATVLTDYGVQQMKKRSFSNDSDKAKFIQQNSYQFSKVIDVPKA